MRLRTFLKEYLMTPVFAIASLITLAAYLVIPLILTYESTGVLSLPEGFGLWGYGFALVLPLLFGLFASITHKKRQKMRADKKHLVMAGTSIISACVVAVASTFSCLACVALLAALIGTGTLVFLAKWKFAIGALSIVSLIVAIYLSLRCKRCT